VLWAMTRMPRTFRSVKFNATVTGTLIAKPNASILYSTLAKGPKLSREDQLNSSRQFFRELNRFVLGGRSWNGTAVGFL
jgi:hypothetical protein